MWLQSVHPRPGHQGSPRPRELGAGPPPGHGRGGASGRVPPRRAAAQPRPRRVPRGCHGGEADERVNNDDDYLLNRCDLWAWCPATGTQTGVSSAAGQ